MLLFKIYAAIITIPYNHYYNDYNNNYNIHAKLLLNNNIYYFVLFRLKSAPIYHVITDSSS